MLVATLLFAATSSAAPALDEIVVHGRSRPPGTDPSASATIIDRWAIDRALDRGAEAHDVVDTVAGARVLDLGGPLQQKRLTLRGGAPSQNLVLVDGQPQHQPFATGLDLGLLDLGGLERIEVVRGGAGAAFGDGALSGALVLTTRSLDRRPRTAASLRFGSFSTAGVSLGAATDSLAIDADYAISEGDFAYVSAPVGLPPLDRVRTNNDAQRGRVGVVGKLSFAGGALTANAAVAARASGVPGFETQADPDARELRGSGHARLGWSNQTLQFGLHASGLTIDYEDPDPVDPIESKTRFASGGVDAAWSDSPWTGHLLGIGGDAQVERSDSSAHGDQIRVRGSVGGSDEYEQGDWLFVGALRLAWTSGFAPQPLPRLGARFAPSAKWSVGTGIGRSLRTPTLDELYHPPERGIEGNPALVPETAWELEVTAQAEPVRGLSFGVVAFGRVVDDVVLYVNRNAFVVRPENLGAALIGGAELEARAWTTVLGMRGQIDVSGALTASRLDVTKRTLPTQPVAAGDVGLSLEPKIAPVELFSRLRLASSTFANLANTIEVEPYVRWDAGATVRLGPSAAVSLSVSNLLDDRGLATVNKIPLPGRMVLASVRVMELPD